MANPEKLERAGGEKAPSKDRTKTVKDLGKTAVKGATKK